MPDETVEKATILQAPVPTKESGQRSVNISDLYLTRFTPPWSRPASLPAYTWRAWVMNQPVALVCRETLIANLEALDWKIIPRNMKYKEELEPVARYYTKLIEKGGNYPELGLDYSGLVEWIVGDMLDVPFGGFAELGRKNDDPKGRVLWIKPVDAGTLYPTLNGDFPTVQYYQGYEVVAFPQHAQSRVLWSPHQYLFREGWGIAPPEKIYFALDLLNRGDKYYANLLLDVPTAGILDLGDMEASAAQEWINSFRAFVNDTTTSFKVPVLYEHNNPVNFLPFGKVPNDLMFDRITLKYAALVAAAYGMTLGDIGLQTTSSSGETLAGSIRQERKTRKTGFARVKNKWISFWNNILPDELEFHLIDYDDELNVAMGRARLATATAFNIWGQMGAFSTQELRSQTLQDGLISISIPDTLPADAQPAPQTKVQERPGALGNPSPASSGGEGEIKSFTVTTSPLKLNKLMNGIVTNIYKKIVHPLGEDELYLAKSMVMDALTGETDTLELEAILKSVSSNSVKFVWGKDFNDEVKSVIPEELHSVNLSSHIKKFKENVRNNVNKFLSQTIAVVTADVVSSELAFDSELTYGYDYIIGEVQRRLTHSLNDFIEVHLMSEVNTMIEEIRKDTSKNESN